MDLRLNCPEQRVVYSPVEICIYCGRTKAVTPLRVEHIFPAGLGGKHEFPRASCDDCGAKTGSVEQKLLRGAFWPIRARTGTYSGRRPKERPSEFEVEYWAGENREPRQIPVNEMSVNIAISEMNPPKILCEGFWDPNYESTHTRITSFDNGGFDEGLFKHILPDSGVSSVTVGEIVDTLLLRRLIAKIAHGYAYANLGPRFKPYLTDLILGNDVSLAENLVGEAQGDVATVHRHGMGYGFDTIQGQKLVVGGVSLFSPEMKVLYLAVVGEVIDGAI